MSFLKKRRSITSGGTVFFFLLRLARIGVGNNKRDPFRIRRPGEIVDAGFRVGEFLGFAATARKNPKLIVLVVVFPAGKKRDPFSIRTPARMFLAFVPESESAILRSVPFRQPEISGPLVLLHVRDLDHVDD